MSDGSQTPRTDALFYEHATQAQRYPDYQQQELAVYQVKDLLEHARQLERELAEAHAQLAAAKYLDKVRQA